MLLKQIREYVDIERASAVEAARRSGRYLVGDWLHVVEARRDGAVILGDDGRPLLFRWRDLGVEDRLRLLLIDEDGAPLQPLALWLTEAGMPMQFDSWENVFSDACARCGRFGVRLSATPHTLRHTFAVHMLTQLVKQHLARTDGKQADPSGNSRSCSATNRS
jgi:hypothetical protein